MISSVLKFVHPKLHCIIADELITIRVLFQIIIDDVITSSIHFCSGRTINYSIFFCLSVVALNVIKLECCGGERPHFFLA